MYKILANLHALYAAEWWPNVMVLLESRLRSKGWWSANNVEGGSFPPCGG